MLKSKLLSNIRFCLLFSLCTTQVWAQETSRSGRESGGFRGREGSSGESGRDSRGPREFSQGGESRRGGFDRGSFDRGSGGTDGRDSRSWSSGRPEGGDRGGFSRSGPPGNFGGPTSRMSGGPGFQPQPSGGAPVTSGGAPNVSGPRQTVVLKTQDRLTIDLPTLYHEADLDGDGQIAFYEWRQWKRGDLGGFYALDYNQDGFLTPAELLKGPRSLTPEVENLASSLPVQAPPTPPVLNASYSGGATAQSVSSSSSVDSSASEPSDNARIAAESLFKRLDTNKDDIISPSEWSRSTHVKAQFQRADINIEVDMTKEDFVKHRVRLGG